MKPLADPLHAPLSERPGVGPERAAHLARLGLFTVHDLLQHRPRRYEDRRHTGTIAQLPPHQAGATRGKIVACGLKRWRHGSKSVFEIILEDGTGRLHCRWWNLPFMEKYFHVGDEVLVFGKVISSKPLTIDHPETEVLDPDDEPSIHLDRIAPIYPLTEGLPQRWLRSFLWRTLAEVESRIGESYPEIALADAARGGTAWLPRARAFRSLHFPAEIGDVETARQRLALDEFIALQLGMQKRRQKLEANAPALPAAGDNRLIKQFLRELGFQLTGAQTRVLREIRADLGGPHPMRRLLQGDVGSGKTVVAACTALMAIESGLDAALMAPTELLAEQHFKTFQKWFASLGVPVELQTGTVKTARDKNRGQLDLTPAGPGLRLPSLSVGTHALIEKQFAPENLGLVIIDEQHKFGVTQRERLVRKGKYPHALVMTATPIPRTLGLTLYGDLDISVIDELPGDRRPVKTFVRTLEHLPRVWEFVRKQLSQGRQAYIVYPRVDDSGAGDVKAVTREFETLQKILTPHRVALLHGRVKSGEREQTMTAFRAGQVQALLATSVIEVGVDVPNATVMVIENADRFGLAQLHQLRGRVGRGGHDSFCILVASARTAEARQRLRILEATSDGFRIAEEDLKLRGPGELLGQEQSGLPPLRFGNLSADGALIERARDLVKDFLKAG